MNQQAVPIILAALLAGGGGGAATWALASDSSPTSKGNEAPIDDNHRGLPSPAAVPVVPGTTTAPRPAGTHEVSHEVSHEATHGASPEATPEASREATHRATSQPEPGDDRGVHPTPGPSETRHSGDDSGGRGSGGRGGSDDGSGHT